MLKEGVHATFLKNIEILISSKGILLYFDKYGYLISLQELDSKSETILSCWVNVQQ